ncbi:MULTISPECIES: ABC transporter permease [Phyllobacterium]|jgi:putative spermidine/putrescine transport system permease protein|uniref:ABC transporter permease n=1 Tax=Phyllobacterium sophorae TaxID=1520277 RepID=A0A2P7B9W2_9HYPH|nr:MULTISPECIES: ABC transporter permease [Phyllobacterium]PSH63264.1 ABC transporter permease [Phyllobacterium sophorae]UXN63970.1 ABC transporter permease [Phyllobacterium sp. A18/5-2]
MTGKSATSRKMLLLAPLLLFLGLAYVVPFLGVVRWSFTLPEPGVGQYRALLTDPLVQSVFARTLRICLVVTAATLVMAYAIAYVWVRGSSVQRMLAEFCILVPFWISVLTRAFGWLAMLSNRGLINTWLQSAGIISEPLALARNELGVIIGMTHFLIPFAVFPIASAMRSIDERVLLAARGMGASRIRIFWTVFVPLTYGGLIGAALIVFVFALGFFVTPAILGGGRSVMVAELVYLRIFQSPDWGLGAAISVVLVLFIGVLLALMRRFIKPAHLVG